MRLGAAIVEVKTTGLNKLNSDFKKAGKSTGAFEKSTTKSMAGAEKAIKQLGSVIGLTLGGALVGMAVKDSIKSFATFESATVDMAKVTSKSLDTIRADILGMSSDLGTSSNLMKGYYQVISAGVKGTANQLDVLTVASQASKAAHIGQGETIKGLTKLMAGYEGQIKSTAEAADLLFTIEKEGQTSVAELIPVIGGLAKVSADLAVNSNELGAALATLSKTAGSTSIAATQYRAILFGLFKPQENMIKVFDELGVSTGRMLVRQEGLAGALELVKQTAASLNIGLGKVFESTEALSGISAIASNNFESFNDSLEVMEEKTGSAETAFLNYQQTMQAQIDTTIADLEKLKISMGETFSPEFIAILRGMSASMEWLRENATALRATIAHLAVGGFIALETTIKTTLLAMGAPFSLAFNSMKATLADFMESVGDVLVKFSKTKEVGQDLQKMAAEMQKTVKPVGFLKKEAEELADELERNKQALKDVIAGMFELTKVEKKAEKSTKEFAHSVGSFFKEVIKDVEDLNKASKIVSDKYLKENKKLFESVDKLHEEFSGNIREREVGKFQFRLDELDKWYQETLIIYEKAGKDTTKLVETYELGKTDIIQEQNEEILKNSEDAFQGMADFYKDALLQMVDGTGSFSDMIIGKLKNLAATIASNLLTNVSNSVLSSIPGLGGVTSALGLGSGEKGLGLTSLLGAGKAGTSIFDAFKTGGVGSAINAGLGFDLMTVDPSFTSGIAQGQGIFPQMTDAGANGIIPSGGFTMPAWLSGAMSIAGVLGGGYGLYQSTQAPNAGIGAVSGGLSGLGAGLGVSGVSSMLGFGSLAAAGPIGLVVGAIVGGVSGYFNKKSAVAKRHRVHRAERAQSVLDELSFGTEEDPFNLDDFNVKSFLERDFGRFNNPQSVDAIGKYGGVTGENVPDKITAIGDALDIYNNAVKDYGSTSLEAVSVTDDLARAVDSFGRNIDSYSDNAKLWVEQMGQLAENLKALQLREISDEFSAGEKSLITYFEQLNRLNLGDHEEATLKYSQALRFLTDSTLPAFSGELAFAMNEMLEAKEVMADMAREEEQVALKTMVLNSNLGLTDRQLALLRDTSSTVNGELISIYESMGLLDEQFILVSADAGAAALSSEWFADSANDLRNVLSSVNIIFEDTAELFKKFNIEIGENEELTQLIKGLYGLADALDLVSSIVASGEGIFESGKGAIESLIAGNWATTHAELLSLSGELQSLSEILIGIGLIDIGGIFGVGGIIVSGLSLALKILIQFGDVLNDIFGDGQANIPTTIEELKKAQVKDSFTQQDALALFSEFSATENTQDKLNFEKMMLEYRTSLAIAEFEAMEEAGIILPEGWRKIFEKGSKDALEQLEEDLVQPFKDFSLQISKDIEAILDTRNIEKEINKLKGFLKNLNIDDNDYLNKSIELRDLVLERYALEKAELESIKSSFQGVLDSVSNQLHAIMTSTDSQRDIFERLGIQKAEVNRLKGLVGSSTGLEQAGFQGELSTALGDYLRLGQEAFQRPSSDYQEIFEFVTAELRAIKTSAMEQVSFAENQIINLQNQTVTELQHIQNAIDRLAGAVLAQPPIKVNVNVNLPDDYKSLTPDSSGKQEHPTDSYDGDPRFVDDVTNIVDDEMRNGRLRESVQRLAASGNLSKLRGAF